MFTGLIQKIGKLEEIRRGGGTTRLKICHDPWDSSLEPGESIAVQGACLTVTGFSDTDFICDVLDETLGRTALPNKTRGDRLNLERAMRLGDRFGGHIVTGHIDGTGLVEQVGRDGQDRTLTVKCSESLAREIVEKGSIACDGASLTVTAVSDTGFDVKLIPFTWEHTTLSELVPGNLINLETDILAKYVRRTQGATPDTGVSMDDLQRAGFL